MSAEQFAFSAPFDEKRVYWIDDKQAVTIHFFLQSDGTASMLAEFSNGKHWDGDHFYAQVTLTNSSSQTLVVARIGAGLNGSMGGKTQVVTQTREFSIPSEYIGETKAVHYEAGHVDEVNDKQFWETLIKAASQVLGMEKNGVVLFPVGGGHKHLDPIVIG